MPKRMHKRLLGAWASMYTADRSRQDAWLAHLDEVVGRHGVARVVLIQKSRRQDEHVSRVSAEN
jgi:hypothetical protein